MKFLTTILLNFVLLCGLYSQNEDIRFQIERIILNDTEISLRETPGFIIAIVDGDDTYYIDFGSKSTEHNEEKLNGSDMFELGSLTKVFTSSLVSVLVEDGVLTYDMLVNDILPDKYENPRLSELTILDLIHHTSSLPVRPHYFGKKNIDPDNPYRYYTKEDLLTFYSRYVPSKDEEIDFKYAHTNYALLEIVLEIITNQEYETLLRRHIFETLGMTQSFVHFQEERDSILTNGYDRALREAKPWTFASFAASEGVKSNLDDLVKFTRANIGISGTYLDDIFAQNTTPELATNFNRRIFTGKGWQIIDQGKRRFDIVTHTGKTGGYTSLVAFIKETKTGVVLLGNSSVGTENLGYLILRMINHNWKRKTP